VVARFPPERVRVPSVQQVWRDLTFIHVAYEPAVVARLLPPRLELDLFEGQAWVGITPFSAAVLPVVPGPRVRRPETDVRTYVRDHRGRGALWFLSLDLDQPLVVAALRVGLGLPYRWARGRVARRGDTVVYVGRRRRPHRPGSFRCEVEVGPPLGRSHTDLEVFLTGRWQAVVPRGGARSTVPVEHEPWPLHHATLRSWRSEDVLRSLGLPDPAGAPHVRFSPGVHAKLGLPRR
jgi:uncharacterized protein